MNVIDIIMDSNEAVQNKKLASQLQKIGDVIYNVSTLFAGDVLVGQYIIERKKTTDLLTKNPDGSLHIWSQLERLNDMRKLGFEPILLVEGKYNDIWYNKTFRKKQAEKARIFGLLNSVLYKYKIPIIKTDSHEDTIIWIKTVIKRAKNPSKKSLRSLRTHPKRDMNYNEKALYILQGFEGIGPSKSRKLLKEFKCIGNMTAGGRATKERLAKIIGEKYAEEFNKVISHKYDGD